MTGWISKLMALADAARPCVLVTVAEAKGSTPREAGAKMIVTANESWGSIGGGNLEHGAMGEARRLLASEAARPSLLSYPLGPALAQCCGGSASVLFEPVAGTGARPAWLAALAESASADASIAVITDVASGRKLVAWPGGHAGSLGSAATDERALERAAAALASGQATRLDNNEWLIETLAAPAFRLYLFGAGHVGRAVVEVLAGTDCAITWVDGRADAFPAAVPENVTVEIADDPRAAAKRAPAGAFYLVMTHSHQLDFDVCAGVLARGDFAYLGLIGSETKRKRFKKRFLAANIPYEAIARLTCPIGIKGLAGKRPKEIAIAAAAELLQHSGGCAAAGARPLRGALGA